MVYVHRQHQVILHQGGSFNAVRVYQAHIFEREQQQPSAKLEVGVHRTRFAARGSCEVIIRRGGTITLISLNGYLPVIGQSFGGWLMDGLVMPQCLNNALLVMRMGCHTVRIILQVLLYCCSLYCRHNERSPPDIMPFVSKVMFNHCQCALQLPQRTAVTQCNTQSGKAFDVVDFPPIIITVQ